MAKATKEAKTTTQPKEEKTALNTPSEGSGQTAEQQSEPKDLASKVKKEWKPAIPVIPDTPTTAQAPVSFPANRPVYTAAPAPQSLAELKDYIVANAGKEVFQDITLPLMQHYNLQDKASAKLVRVALEQLEAEKRVVVEGDYWKNLGKHHYNNGPETSFYSLRDIKVSIRKV